MSVIAMKDVDHVITHVKTFRVVTHATVTKDIAKAARLRVFSLTVKHHNFQNALKHRPQLTLQETSHYVQVS
jgi:hypothetical protein